MANRQKYTRAAVGHLTAHFERKKDEQGNYYKFGNQDIDAGRSYLNYNLAATDQSLNQNEFINNRIKELKCLNRANVNVMMTWVVTLPKEMNDKSNEEKKKFFSETYKFLCDRYGAENVISAWVHMDENQPHMHFAWTPVCYDKKAGRDKFNAKVVGSKMDLKSFHKDIDYYLTKEMGYVTGVRNGVTEINMTPEQLKETQKEIVREAQKELSELKVEKKEVKVNPLTKKRSITFSEGEYDNLAKKHALELLEMKAKKKELEIDNELLNKKVKELREKPYIQSNEELETQNRALEESNANLTNEKKELEDKVIQLETKNLEIDRLKNDNFKLTKSNLELRNQQNEDMGYLERLLARLWAFVKGLSQIIPSVENHVLEQFNDAEIDDLENNLAMIQPKEKEREIDY